MSGPLVTIRTVGAVELAVDMSRWAGDLDKKAKSVTAHYGMLVRDAARALAAARFDVTDYHTTIRYRTSTGTRGWVRADIGTDDPAGYRHELGFIGVDVAGRSYHDRPRPHFGPALDRYALAYEAAIAGLVVPP